MFMNERLLKGKNQLKTFYVNFWKVLGCTIMKL